MSIKKTDVATILSKGLIGAIPFIGPLAAEIVGTIIPNQRMARIEDFLKLLESKIAKEDRDKVQQKITSPESIDLIEDGFIQASRALSKERKDYIASLLKNSLTNDDLAHIEHKRLLSLLGELNDLEILILKSYTMPSEKEYAKEFWAQHVDALRVPTAYHGPFEKKSDKHALFHTHRRHLVNVSLLRPRFKKPKRGEYPEFDEKTGMVKAEGYKITTLGHLLLRSIDQNGEL